MHPLLRDTLMLKAIIFDLGNVVMKVDQGLSISQFKELGALDLEQLMNSAKGINILNSFETGHISSAQFREAVKELWNITHVSDEDYDLAWNAMLLDIPIQHLEFIAELKKEYKTYLLSNTNNIHLNKIRSIYSYFSPADFFNQCFDLEFYSHEMACRKPDKLIFEKVLQAIQIAPKHIIFVDDLLENINTAKSLGFHTLHINAETTLFDLKALLDREKNHSIKAKT